MGWFKLSISWKLNVSSLQDNWKQTLKLFENLNQSKQMINKQSITIKSKSFEKSKRTWWIWMAKWMNGRKDTDFDAGQLTELFIVTVGLVGRFLRLTGCPASLPAVVRVDPNFAAHASAVNMTRIWTRVFALCSFRLASFAIL